MIDGAVMTTLDAAAVTLPAAVPPSSVTSSESGTSEFTTPVGLAE
jgi:hypothetical protein